MRSEAGCTSPPAEPTFGSSRLSSTHEAISDEIKGIVHVAKNGDGGEGQMWKRGWRLSLDTAGRNGVPIIVFRIAVAGGSTPCRHSINKREIEKL